MDGVGGPRIPPEQMSPLKGPVSGSGNIEEAGPSNRNIGSPVPTKVGKPSQIAPADPSKVSEQPKTPFKPIARPMTESDIIDQLLLIQKEPTPENKLQLLKMIQHGVAASEDVFDLVSKLVKSHNKNKSIEAAVIAVTKGLSQSSKAVDILNSFLTNQNQLAKQLEQLQVSLKSFFTIFKQAEGLFQSGLFAGIEHILSSLEKDLKKLSKKSSQSEINLAKIKPEILSKDLSTFHSFLGGLAQLLDKSSSAKAMVLLGRLEDLKTELSNFLQSLSLHSILSTDNESAKNLINDRFYYWQLPNPVEESPSTMELLIQKDEKGNNINENKTKIIMKLDTQALGSLGIILEIVDRKLWYTFQSDNTNTRAYLNYLSADLRDRMLALNYQLIGFKTTAKRLDTKKYLIPKFNLDNLSRVRTEI